MNIMKKVVLAMAFCIVATTVNAQFFDRLGASVGVGTNGISVDLSTRITDFVNMRAGVDFMPGITFNSDAEFEYDAGTGPQYSTIGLKGDLGRVQGHVIFNVYPLRNVLGLYIAAGAYFGGDKLVKISGHSDELAGLSSDGYAVIGDYLIPVDPQGNVSGGLKVNGFRPYLGIGWGRAIPGKLLNFGIDLGVQFEGHPEPYTDYGELDQSLVEDDNTFNKICDALSVYPVLTFKLNFRAL